MVIIAGKGYTDFSFNVDANKENMGMGTITVVVYAHTVQVEVISRGLLCPD